MNLDFKPPGPVARRFMLDPSFVRGLRGPVGSAKSSTSIVELLRQWMMARPNERGQRKTRTAIIRNTNPMLKTTTMETYAEWLDPEVFGQPKMAPPPYEHEIVVSLQDNTEMVAQVYFLSLDRAEDMRKLLSLELTWAFINEARELPKTIVDGVTQRLRRYPSMRDGGFERSGLIMDTNAPDADHWWPIMAGEAPPPEGMSEQDIANLVKPHDWAFFTQPPAMLEQFEGEGKKRRVVGYEINPEAENIQNLDPKYYPGQVAGKTKAWIDVYIMNRLGAVTDGRPVHAEFREDVHTVAGVIEPVPNIPFILGLDFGLTPSAIFYQRVRDRWAAFDEIVLEGAGAVQLGQAINRRMTDRYPGHKISVAWGDPSGDQRAATDKKTPFQILRALKIPARPTDSNDPEIRRTAMRTVLTRMAEGEPAMVISKERCPVFAAGMAGAWFYKRVRGAGEMFEDEPTKNRYSHPCEAGEYALQGGGEARAAMGRLAGAAKVANVRTRTDPLDRFSQARRASSRTTRRW